MTALTNASARTDVLNRLKRAEGQIRGIHRMVEEGESCLKIGQQFSAVRKALDSTYLRMTLCFMAQELDACLQPDDTQKADLALMLKDMETLLARMGHEAGAAIESALTALRNDDIELARSVVARDSQIDAGEHEIEHRCLQLLLRQQPVASDLRKVSTALKMVTDVERIGDQASDIAELVLHLHAKSTDAVGVLEDAARAALAKAGKTAADIDWLIPHQANIRIMQSTAKRLKLPMDKVIVTVDQHGNTSAASIPLALDSGVRSGQIQKGQTLMLEGVGGGFTWGAVLLNL